jgi:hypothetical protein
VQEVLPHKPNTRKGFDDKLAIKVLPQKTIKGLALFESITE